MFHALTLKLTVACVHANTRRKKGTIRNQLQLKLTQLNQQMSKTETSWHMWKQNNDFAFVNLTTAITNCISMLIKLTTTTTSVHPICEIDTLGIDLFGIKAGAQGSTRRLSASTRCPHKASAITFIMVTLVGNYPTFSSSRRAFLLLLSWMYTLLWRISRIKAITIKTTDLQHARWSRPWSCPL